MSTCPTHFLDSCPDHRLFEIMQKPMAMDKSLSHCVDINFIVLTLNHPPSPSLFPLSLGFSKTTCQPNPTSRFQPTLCSYTQDATSIRVHASTQCPFAVDVPLQRPFNCVTSIFHHPAQAILPLPADSSTPSLVTCGLGSSPITALLCEPHRWHDWRLACS